MTEQSETQRQIEEKRRQDQAALDQAVKDRVAETERRRLEEWRN